MKAGITAAVPACHEAENLRWILPILKKALDETGEEYTILVIDTAEPTDETPDICRAEGVDCIPQTYPGFAGAIRTAIECADREKLLTMDADGSHDPAYIPGMVRMFTDKKCDLLIGSRYVPGGGSNDRWVSICMSRLLNLVFQRIIGTDVKDISSGFKIYNTEKLRSIEITGINFEIHQEALLKLFIRYSDFRVSEYPIVFERRRYDRSKRKLGRFVLSYVRSVFKLIKLRKQANYPGSIK